MASPSTSNVAAPVPVLRAARWPWIGHFLGPAVVFVILLAAVGDAARSRSLAPTLLFSALGLVTGLVAVAAGAKFLRPAKLTVKETHFSRRGSTDTKSWDFDKCGEFDVLHLARKETPRVTFAYTEPPPTWSDLFMRKQEKGARQTGLSPGDTWIPSNFRHVSADQLAVILNRARAAHLQLTPPPLGDGDTGPTHVPDETPVRELSGREPKVWIYFACSLMIFVTAGSNLLLAGGSSSNPNDMVLFFWGLSIAGLLVTTPPLFRPSKLILTRSTLTLKSAGGARDTWDLRTSRAFAVAESISLARVSFEHADRTRAKGFRVVVLPAIQFGKMNPERLAAFLGEAAFACRQTDPNDLPMPRSRL